MLVAAGYFNYSTFNQETQETYSEVAEEKQEESNIGDAVLVSNNEEQNTNAENNTEETSVQNLSNQNIFQDVQNTVTVNETNEIQTSSTQEIKEDETNYYASSKLDREKMYAEMISSYQEIINNEKCSEAQKNIATQEITKINNTKNALMICENLLLAKKEFKNCVILINDASVNVVVNIDQGLTTEKVAQIQNIVSREIGTQIENIHITEK